MGRYKVTTESGKQFIITTETTAGQSDGIQSPTPSTGIGKIASGISTLARETSPLTSTPGRFLESKGKKTKDAVNSIISNLVSSPFQGGGKAILGRAALGTAASVATDYAPFTPQEIAITLGGAVLPAGISAATRGIQKSSVNRALQVPKQIREGRLLKGEPTVGEEFLSFDEFTTGDKNEIFGKASAGIKRLGAKVRAKINEITIKGGGQKGVPPFTKDINEPFIRTSDIAGKIDPLISEAQSAFGQNSSQARQLIRFKQNFMSGKPERLNFRQANELREQIGDVVGRRFNKESGDLPELVQAQRSMFAELRNQIGKISPDIDEALGRQHALFDIKNTVLPEASKGYTEIPRNFIELLSRPVFANVRLATFLKRMGDTRGGGIVTRAGQMKLESKENR